MISLWWGVGNGNEEGGKSKTGSQETDEEAVAAIQASNDETLQTGKTGDFVTSIYDHFCGSSE